MEDQPPCRSIRLEKLHPLSTVEPPPPAQRKRLDTKIYFESTGVSESPWEPKI